MDKAAIVKEEKRLKTVLDALAPGKRVVAESLCKNIAFDSVRIDEMREALRSQDNVIAYNNGGGQAGIRKNPELELYMSLSKQLMQEIKQLSDMIPDTATDDAKDVLAEWQKRYLH